MRRSIVIAVVFSLVLSAATSADFPVLTIGDAVDVQFTHVGPRTDVYIASVHTAFTRVQAGVYNLNVDGVSMQSFCIDLQQLASTGTHPYEVKALKDAPDEDLGPMGEGKAAALSELLARNWTDSLNSIQAAALQVAVWEVVADWDGGHNLSDGDFRLTTTGDVRTQAEAYLNSIVGEIPATDYFFVALSSGAYQDFVVRAVPVPGAALLGFLGLGTAGMKLRRWIG